MIGNNCLVTRGVEPLTKSRDAKTPLYPIEDIFTSYDIRYYVLGPCLGFLVKLLVLPSCSRSAALAQCAHPDQRTGLPFPSPRQPSCEGAIAACLDC